MQVTFLIVAVVLTLFLARWQWNAWHQSGGSFQNLGYAIQWPIFGLLLIIGYRKYIAYERERLEGNVEAAIPPEQRSAMREIPQDVLGSARPGSVTAVDFEDDRRRTRRQQSPPVPSPQAQPRDSQKGTS